LVLGWVVLFISPPQEKGKGRIAREIKGANWTPWLSYYQDNKRHPPMRVKDAVTLDLKTRETSDNKRKGDRQQFSGERCFS
jgi:hypothetical protein